MWVEKTKQDKYKYIERYTDPLTGKYRRVSVVLDKIPHKPRNRLRASLQRRSGRLWIRSQKQLR